MRGDCLEALEHLQAESVDLIFADPPYFLSNGGTTGLAAVRAGHHYIGIDREHEYLDLTRKRLCDAVVVGG